MTSPDRLAAGASRTVGPNPTRSGDERCVHDSGEILTGRRAAEARRVGESSAETKTAGMSPRFGRNARQSQAISGAPIAR